MKRKKIFYYTGIVKQNFNDGIFHSGLNETTRVFCLKNNINQNFSIFDVPYCNVSIMNIDYLRNSEIYKKFCEEINDEGGIFISRWGSPILWGEYLNMTQIINTNFWEDNTVKYYHGSHDMYIN